MTDEEEAALTAERDALQARIDAYEGDLQEWEHVGELIRESSLGTAAAESVRNRTPREVGKAILLASQYLARAETAETERDRLRAIVDADDGPVAKTMEYLGQVEAERNHERGLRQGLDRLANTLFEERDEARGERDRLRAVVERAHDHVATDEHVLRSLATDDLVALVGVLRQDCRDAMIENDRLRAVVEALRFALTLIAAAAPEDAVERHRQVARDALDVSGDMGGDPS